MILPSGQRRLAVGAVLLIRAGVPTHYATSRSAVLFLATSAVSFVALVAAGTLEAVGILPGDASLAATLIPAAVAALVMVAAIVLSHPAAEVRARPEQRGPHLHRPPAALPARGRRPQHRADPQGGPAPDRRLDWLLRLRRRLALGLLRGARGRRSGARLFVIAYVLGHGGAIIPVPGSAEGGLVGAFTLYGAAVSLSVGAILVYRTFHAGVPVILALGGYADIRRLRGERDPAEVARRFD